MNRVTEPDQELEAWMSRDEIGPVRPEIVRTALERARTLEQRRGRGLGRRWLAAGTSFGWAVRAGVVAVIVVAAVAVLGEVGPGTPAGVGGPGSPASLLPSPSTQVIAEPPYGLAVVDIDGVIRQDLGLPEDAWMPDLSADGELVVFLTADVHVAECGGCGVPRRPVAIPVGETHGAFIYPGPKGADGQPIVAMDELNQPVLSPDGTMIAFQGITGPERNRDIYAGKLERSGPTWGVNLVRLTDDPAIDEFPVWSPDGTTITYANGGGEPLDTAGFSPTQELWSVPATGGTPTRLTDDHGADTMPDVAPDGRLAWWHEGEIWSMAADGSDRRLLIPRDGENVFNPVWSPDGTRIALLRYDPSERAPAQRELGRTIDLPLLRVQVVDIATGTITDLGVRVITDANPVSWLPDGQSLLVNRYDGGTPP